ncbi:uncharacterized protein LOC110427986 [Herrania umbratica]|uniref:Uncharacterized protein LOC110427986 n=1 Tax=Herrania umbratica TaxID=108875 RepID=A0A6J1BJP8_9ROSI|nr:uncharacterized protein LOC110427986 [Herrania umbratica]
MLKAIEPTPKDYPSRSNRKRHGKHRSEPDDEEPKTNEEHPDSAPSKQPRKRRRNPRRKRYQPPFSSNDPAVRTAMYVAMAHAGLALTLALLFGLSKLLQNYWRPIQWAILCSMPLRGLQTLIVSFWSHPLSLGLFETLIAIPIAILRATTASLLDSHAALLRLFSCRSSPRPAGRRRTRVGFYKLMQWLVSFGLFVLVYERIGFFSIPAVTVPCFVAYTNGFAVIIRPGLATTLSRISSARQNRKKFHKNRSFSFFCKGGQYITSMMFKRLNTMVGIGLILFMIVGSILGFLFFSYKIAIEGKEAVISLKIHLEENNYGEIIGISKWMDENQVPELIDSYMSKFYETLSQNIDSWAVYYNVTEVVDGFKQYFVQSSVVSCIPDEKVGFRRPVYETLYSLQSKVRNGEWKVIYRDINGEFRKFMSLIANEDLLEKIKAFLLQSLDVSKKVLFSCSMVLARGANLLFFVAILIVSGAAGLVNFIFELMVFLWLLYYLITSDSGGVMDHVLGMLPVSRSTRNRCAQVLDHAVSSVLLATAKVTLFQGCFTYLLFRFYRIHFLYMSTFLALLSALLPITPAWISSIPAALQLAMESRYIEAILLTAVHVILLDYGTMAIQDEIPGHNTYLTCLSIFGGIAFFPSILEGAIMGPLVMTVIIALKNLYVEFVLAFAALVSNSDRVFDFFTHLLIFNGGTFKFRGPWFPSLDFVLTSDPMNVNRILCRNYDNYEKGAEFREIFEPFGEGIVTSDSHVWRNQRRVLQSFTKNNKK